jgi:hypothetical protein
MDVDRPVVRVLALLPYLGEHLAPRDDLSRTLSEHEQEIELLPGQLQWSALGRGSAGAGVDDEVSDRERSIALSRAAAAQDRANSRVQVPRAERLGEHVVRPGVERFHDRRVGS